MWPINPLMILAGFVALLSGVLVGWASLGDAHPQARPSLAIDRSLPREAQPDPVVVAIEEKPAEVASPPDAQIFPTRKLKKKIVGRPNQGPVVRRAIDDDDDDDD